MSGSHRAADTALTAEALRGRLQELHARTGETPLFNPVFQLGLELSRRIESGEAAPAAIEALAAQLECDAIQARAKRLGRLIDPVDTRGNEARVRDLAETGEDSFEAFAARWSEPLLHCVFTGHPTFLLSRAQSQAICEAASSGDISPAAVCMVGSEREAITLEGEHADALAAIGRAGAARDRIVTTLLEVAARRWPDRWRALRPVPFRFASWVGYDMDGRTDITWAKGIAFRLQEKAERLAGYAASLRAAGAEAIATRLAAAEAHARELSVAFSADLSDPATMTAAANRLTAEHPDNPVSLAPVIAELEEAARAADTDRAIALLTIVAAMRADGLGMGWIHFRINSTQLHNAIRRRIDPRGQLDLASRGALIRLRKALASAQKRPLRANFAALAVENTTAIRQFLAIAQILKHIDADAPVRMLIAECQEPQTILCALYFARLFGIEERIDISPLFETEQALEHGGRFLDDLLAEPAYQAYVRGRGRLCIQTGFSDAGRFVGQIPAALAIERLQGRLAQAMAARGLTGITALIFNTHGESMGRGAHPGGMADRLDWPMTPWARKRFAVAGIALEKEVSFQGGDGYLFFGTPELALATLTRIAEVGLSAEPDGEEDPFYTRPDISLDYYRSIRGVQRAHLESRTYSRAIMAFGLGLLNETGSRRSRRQSDLAGEREMSLRQIRAIPHNAVLQQLGYPVNVLAGAGTAAQSDAEAVAELLSASARGRALVRLLRASNALASIKTLAAYGELYNSAYWASRPYRGTEPELETACLDLAEHLVGDDRAGVFRRLASRLRVDGVKLHRLLALLPDEVKLADREEVRRNLGLLHALRLALMQHIFLRAAQVPAFSRANDISRDDVLEMVFALRIDEAVTQLRRAYPVAAPTIGDFAVDEPGDYPDDLGEGYGAIQRDYIDRIAWAHALCLRISVAIANHFGAHG